MLCPRRLPIENPPGRLGKWPEPPNLRLMTPKAVLFDLDGTLVDQFEAIHRSCNHAERRLGLPESSYEKVRATVGGSLDVTLRRLMGERYVEEAQALYHEEFSKIWFENLKVMPGARWLLQALARAGIPCGMLTNKRQAAVENILRYLNVDSYFRCIVGTHGDGPRKGWRKPEARLTQFALEQLGYPAMDTVMVGDSPFDAETGHNSGMPVHLVATGTHTATQLRNVGCAGLHANLFALGSSVFGFVLPPESVTALP